MRNHSPHIHIPLLQWDKLGLGAQAGKNKKISNAIDCIIIRNYDLVGCAHVITFYWSLLDMMRWTSTLFMLVVSTVAFAGSETHAREGPMDAATATQMAAEPPYSVAGAFQFVVLGTGHGVGAEKGRLFLNSQEDYRDQNCLTAKVLRGAIKGLKAKFGDDLEVVLKDKEIVVTGEARRFTVWVRRNGRQTGQYYYQTHILVSSADQISLAE